MEGGQGERQAAEGRALAGEGVGEEGAWVGDLALETEVHAILDRRSLVLLLFYCAGDLHKFYS